MAQRLAAVLLGLFCCSLTMGCAERAAEARHWVATWGAPADQAGPAFHAQTIRQVVRTSIGGSRVRIRLSNLYGSAPVTIGPVRIAQSQGGSAIQPATDRIILFNGQPLVTIPKGAEILSDEVAFPVGPLAKVAVSLYVPGRAREAVRRAPPARVHRRRSPPC